VRKINLERINQKDYLPHERKSYLWVPLLLLAQWWVIELLSLPLMCITSFSEHISPFCRRTFMQIKIRECAID